MVITSLKDLFDFSYVRCSSLTFMQVSLLGYGKMFAMIMKLSGREGGVGLTLVRYRLGAGAAAEETTTALP